MPRPRASSSLQTQREQQAGADLLVRDRVRGAAVAKVPERDARLDAQCDAR